MARLRSVEAKALVGGGGHHIAGLEGRGVLARGHEATDVRDVRHEDGAHLVVVGEFF